MQYFGLDHIGDPEAETNKVSLIIKPYERLKDNYFEWFF